MVIFSPLRARKSDNYRYRDSWKSDNFRKEAIKIKQRTDTKKDTKRIKSENFTRSNRESPILLSQYCKIECLDGTIIISHFDGSNNICRRLYNALSHQRIGLGCV